MSRIQCFLVHHAFPRRGVAAWVRGKARTSAIGMIGHCCFLVLLLMGCSRDDEAAVKINPDDRPLANDEGSNTPPSVESIVSEGETKETVSLWSKEIKSQLGLIAEALLDEEELRLPESLSLPIEMFDPHLLQTKELHQGRSVRVTEIRAPEALQSTQAEPTAFLANLRQLLLLDPNASQQTVRFKLFAVNTEGEFLKTRQRLMGQGTIEGKQAQSSAVVDATWEVPSEGGKESPRLVGWSMPVLVRNELTTDENVKFEDIAGAVLGGNAAWNEQLQLGMNTWRRHIDRSLNPDFLGYHGLAVGDVDGDGLEDLYLCQPGGLPNLLFRQQKDGTLVDISAAARVDWLDNTTGALLVDLDNDGDADLALATRTAFLVMENDGSGRFSLVERFTSIGMGYSPTAADYDLDGDLDLLVLRYAADGGKVGDFPTPHPFHSARNGGANILLQNQGNLGFVDITDDCGLGVENYRFSFAASWEDYDNDGDVDLYIANDFGPNQLFRNEGEYFVDESSLSGTQDWGFGMSATWADYDRDGHMDLYVSSMFSGAGNQVVSQTDFNANMPEETRSKYLKMVRGNTLLRNSGEGHFSDVTNPMAEGFGGWAWGAKFADFDNDGWEDLYVANGYISQPDTDDL